MSHAGFSGRIRWALCLLLVGATAAHAQSQGINGKILKKDGGEVVGALRWQPASRVYAVTVQGQGGVQLKVPIDQVRDILVPEPPGLSQAAQQVRAGSASAAIGALEKIKTDYAMLKHDVTAAALLAEAYLKMNDPKKAEAMCQQVIAQSPDAAASGDLQAVYWEALKRNGKDAILKGELTKAISSGSRVVAARAQIIRGEIDEKDGKVKEALVDGYLRTALLYQDIKEVQPEALYKTVKAFERLGQLTYAEKFRKRLIAEFPQDSWTQKLRAGS